MYLSNNSSGKMLAASRGLISSVAPMGPPVFVFFLLLLLLLSFSFVPNLPSEQLAHLFPSFLAGCHSIMPACHKQAHHYQQLMPFSSSSSSCLSSQNHSSTHTHTLDFLFLYSSSSSIFYFTGSFFFFFSFRRSRMVQFLRFLTGFRLFVVLWWKNPLLTGIPVQSNYLWCEYICA